MNPEAAPDAAVDLTVLGGAFAAAGQKAVDALAGWATGSEWVADHRALFVPFGHADTLLGRTDGWHCVVIDTFAELYGTLLMAMSDPSAVALAADASAPAGAAGDDPDTAGGQDQPDAVAATLAETANILTSAYLNGLRERLGGLGGSDAAFLPSPPGRAQAGPVTVLRIALGGQGSFDGAFIARTQASRADAAVALDLIYVPGRAALPFLELAAAGVGTGPAVAP